jgi:hypothetical protein
VTHLVFHTYTHNPRTDVLPPGSSFGTGIGTPFLRLQTWWQHMPGFTDYLARCNYMLEAGRPVSDVLMYLGDEQNHKPLQNLPFPEGYSYDYCNPDILLNRLSVRDGHWSLPKESATVCSGCTTASGCCPNPWRRLLRLSRPERSLPAILLLVSPP